MSIFRKSFPFFHQLDARDCGAACLQMIARHYGKSYSLRTLREYSFISREGASLMGIVDAAEKLVSVRQVLRPTWRFLEIEFRYHVSFIGIKNIMWYSMR